MSSCLLVATQVARHLINPTSVGLCSIGRKGVARSMAAQAQTYPPKKARPVTQTGRNPSMGCQAGVFEPASLVEGATGPELCRFGGCASLALLIGDVASSTNGHHQKLVAYTRTWQHTCRCATTYEFEGHAQLPCCTFCYDNNSFPFEAVMLWWLNRKALRVLDGLHCAR
jgi:hypothetical protein